MSVQNGNPGSSINSLLPGLFKSNGVQTVPQGASAKSAGTPAVAMVVSGAGDKAIATYTSGGTPTVQPATAKSAGTPTVPQAVVSPVFGIGMAQHPLASPQTTHITVPDVFPVAPGGHIPQSGPNNAPTPLGMPPRFTGLGVFSQLP